MTGEQTPDPRIALIDGELLDALDGWQKVGEGLGLTEICQRILDALDEWEDRREEVPGIFGGFVTIGGGMMEPAPARYAVVYVPERTLDPYSDHPDGEVGAAMVWAARDALGHEREGSH